jgi:hypothetical protein
MWSGGIMKRVLALLALLVSTTFCLSKTSKSKTKLNQSRTEQTQASKTL